MPSTSVRSLASWLAGAALALAAGCTLPGKPAPPRPAAFVTATNCAYVGVPADWVRTVEEAVGTDPYTVSKRTMREEAEGLHRACLNELRRSQVADRELESMA